MDPVVTPIVCLVLTIAIVGINTHRTNKRVKQAEQKINSSKETIEKYSNKIKKLTKVILNIENTVKEEVASKASSYTDTVSRLKKAIDESIKEKNLIIKAKNKDEGFESVTLINRVPVQMFVSIPTEERIRLYYNAIQPFIKDYDAEQPFHAVVTVESYATGKLNSFTHKMIFTPSSLEESLGGLANYKLDHVDVRRRGVLHYISISKICRETQEIVPTNTIFETIEVKSPNVTVSVDQILSKGVGTLEPEVAASLEVENYKAMIRVKKAKLMSDKNINK